jgi:hypothetical protein
MLKLDDGGHRLTAHIFDSILITEPIRTFHRIVHVPLPTILAEIAKAGRNTSLCGDGMAAGREHFCDACRLQPCLDSTLGGAQSGAAGPHNDHVISMVDKFVCTRCCHGNLIVTEARRRRSSTRPRGK